ncbi:OTU-like cysteine protease [Teratosphaeria destructans]|uniref:Ubiquitin thioesterase OTU n=1 Tax=Teratosphaeria destructans TaxID=418781 RepID=A0A9W7SNM3_9PEZI|nr:OTU-like cysteine protease [Teratosphaeria destructans]
MRLRVRGPQGVASVTIDDNATWKDLQTTIQEKTGVPDFDMKYGYPPKPLNTESIGGSMKLSDLPINLNGEQLIIMPRSIQAQLSSPMSGTKPPSEEVKALPPRQLTSPPQHQKGDFPREQRNMSAGSVESEPPEVPVPQLDGVMVLRVMPDDNSCMFRAVSSAMLGSTLDGMNELRSVVAQTIQGDPDFYNEGILGMPREKYCQRIQREDCWGGYIELQILSKHFDIEFVSIDIQTLRADKYNEGKDRRCFLVYSGIHYDVLAVQPLYSPTPDNDRKVFDVLKIGDEEEDGGVTDAALRLCKELQSRHYFTDTAGFDVKCNTCGQQGNGEKWAMTHAAATGHVDFGEGKD